MKLVKFNPNQDDPSQDRDWPDRLGSRTEVCGATQVNGLEKISTFVFVELIMRKLSHKTWMGFKYQFANKWIYEDNQWKTT